MREQIVSIRGPKTINSFVLLQKLVICETFSQFVFLCSSFVFVFIDEP